MGKTKKRLRMLRALYKTISVVAGCLCALVIIFGAICAVRYGDFAQMRTYLDRDTFYPGVKVDGVDLGGYTLAEALDAFEKRETDYAESRALVYQFDGKEYTYTPEQMGYKTDCETQLRKAYAIGRSGSIDKRYAQASKGASLTITRSFDKEALTAIAQEVAEVCTTPVQEPTITDFNAKTGAFTVSPSSAGTTADVDTLYVQTLAAVESGGPITVNAEREEPKHTQEEMQSSYGMISSAVTNASSSTANRLNNIRLACESINGTVLQPGDSFSFNEVVGKRTKSAGYKIATVFQSGELGEEVGGGVCQVATTLFNAAVKADLTINERHAHSRPVGYVEKGKDATVSWGLQDLKFTNTLDEPVYLVAGVSKDKRVKIYVFGAKRTDGLTISLMTSVKEIKDPGADKYVSSSEIPSGTTRVKSEARKGYRVNTYKAYVDAKGNAVRKEFLCESSYPAAAAVIEVGL